MIEASLVIAVMALALFGTLQMSRIFSARHVLDYAAHSAARARAVGLNPFMVHKVVRVSTIPNAGPLLTPETPLAADTALDWANAQPGWLWDQSVAARVSGSPRAAIEIQRMPFYLGAQHQGQLSAILDYDDWPTVTHTVDYPSADEVRVQVRQRLPIRFPMSRTFIGGESITLDGGGTGARMANHAQFYLY